MIISFKLDNSFVSIVFDTLSLYQIIFIYCLSDYFTFSIELCSFSNFFSLFKFPFKCFKSIFIIEYSQAIWFILFPKTFINSKTLRSEKSSYSFSLIIHIEISFIFSSVIISCNKSTFSLSGPGSIP